MSPGYLVTTHHVRKRARKGAGVKKLAASQPKNDAKGGAYVVNGWSGTPARKVRKRRESEGAGQRT